jgi:hypothetical protein
MPTNYKECYLAGQSRFGAPTWVPWRVRVPPPAPTLRSSKPVLATLIRGREHILNTSVRVSAVQRHRHRVKVVVEQVRIGVQRHLGRRVFAPACAATPTRSRRLTPPSWRRYASANAQVGRPATASAWACAWQCSLPLASWWWVQAAQSSRLNRASARVGADRFFQRTSGNRHGRRHQLVELPETTPLLVVRDSPGWPGWLGVGEALRRRPSASGSYRFRPRPGAYRDWSRLGHQLGVRSSCRSSSACVT